MVQLLVDTNNNEVLEIEIKGRFKVYPFIELEKRPAEFTETVNGLSVIIAVYADASNWHSD